MFRPVNSSESNQFIIRASLGYGSPAGVFGSNGAINTNTVIASNSIINIPPNNYLASPSSNNLPNNFYIQYINNGAIFRVYYGKTFTSPPTINVTASVNTTIAIPCVFKTSNLYCDIYFRNYTQSAVLPSSDGLNGLIGFDLLIMGPVKIDTITGSSSKGWNLVSNSLAEPTCAYSELNINLGSTFTMNNSVVISKNLKLLGSNNTVKICANGEPLDYTQTVWTLAVGTSLTNIQPKLGMVLIVIGPTSIIAPSSTIVTAANSFFNNINTKITFTAVGDCVILYGTSTTNFNVISKTNGISITPN
jgi:hypothetical protein